MSGLNIPRGKIYTDSLEERIVEQDGSKLRMTRLRNYEQNRKLIQEWGGFMGLQPIERALVVGAGWGLEKFLDDLRDLDIPVIACDKVAKMLPEYVCPHIVTAVNTEKTEVGNWLGAFMDEMKRWGHDIGKVTLVCPVTVHPDTLKGWEGKIAFVNQEHIPEISELCEKETGIPPTIRGMNVGTFSIILATMLGANNVAMVGMPFSFLTKEDAMDRGGQWHYIAMRDINDVWVYTTFEWLYMRNEVIDFCRQIKEHVDVRYVNLSDSGILYEGGAIEAMSMKRWKKAIG